MSDDIVTRLRNECQCSDDCRAENDPCIPMQAADEIERLRADRDRWMLTVTTTAKHYKELLQKMTAERNLWRDLAEEYYLLDPKCHCHLCDRMRVALEQTIRP